MNIDEKYQKILSWLRCNASICSDPAWKRESQELLREIGEPLVFEPKVKNYVIQICNDCYYLHGEMCHEPECIFCRRTMKEVATILDSLLIRPVVDGERLKL